VGFRSALIAALIVAAPLCEAAEESTAAIQHRIKAAFLYKFAAYVEWPPKAFAEPESPLVIGVAGADAIAKELQHAVAGRTVGGRPMQVRRLAHGERASDCCQILFIGRGDRERASELLADAQGRPVLTVTETDAEQSKGSVINFLAEDGRVRFDISREAADRNGLRLRSQLLGVARQVVSQ
jgi:hypothetical protein